VHALSIGWFGVDLREKDRSDGNEKGVATVLIATPLLAQRELRFTSLEEHPATAAAECPS
jgi:hypothetical protein